MVLSCIMLAYPFPSLERMFYYMDKFQLTVAQPGIINAQVGRCIYQPKRNEGYMIQVCMYYKPASEETARYIACAALFALQLII